MDIPRLQHATSLLDSGMAEECLFELQALEGIALDSEEKATVLGIESRCLLFMGRLAEARQRLTSAKQIAPSTQGLLYLDFFDAVLQWREGKRDESLRILNRLYKDYRDLLVTPEHLGLYQQVQSSLGMFLTELARYKEARPLLEGSLSFDQEVGNTTGVLYNLGLCYQNLGENKLAKEKFLEVLLNGAERATVAQSHYHLGTIYFVEGAHAKAVSEFEACLPDAKQAQIPDQNIYGWLASSARAAGQASDAERYEKLAKGQREDTSR